MNTWVIASLTFRETLRRKALYGAIFLTVIFLSMFAFGSYHAFADIMGDSRMSQDIRMLATGEILLAGCFGIANIGGLLAIFVAAGTIAGEVDEGTLHSVVPRPLHRWEIVIGKWLGFSLMLAVYVGVTGLVACLTIYWLTGYLSPNLFAGLALLSAKSILLLSLAMMLSTWLPTLASGIVAFILYAVSNVGGMVEQFGYLINNQTMKDIGIVTSLIIPSDSIWKMAADQLQPPIGQSILATLQAAGPFSVLNPPSVWMGVYAAVYTIAMLSLGCYVFTRRDL